MAPIVGCSWVAVAYLSCVFNPLMYPPNFVTKTTSKISFSQDGLVTDIYLYEPATWPQLKGIYINDEHFLCAKGLCKHLIMEPSTIMSTITPTIKILKLDSRPTLLNIITSGITETTITHFTTIPTTPSPILLSTLTSSSAQELSFKTSMKKILDKFLQDIKEGLLGVIGSIFSVGGAIFMLRMLVKYVWRRCANQTPQENQIENDSVQEESECEQEEVEAEEQEEEEEELEGAVGGVLPGDAHANNTYELITYNAPQPQRSPPKQQQLRRSVRTVRKKPTCTTCV